MSLTSIAKTGANLLGIGLYASVCYFCADAILAPKFNQKPQIETIWEDAKKEYETYKEIKSEGIKADSYSEAKVKLDAIKTDRLYKKYGLEAPNEKDSPAERLIKELNLQIQLNHEAQNSQQEILNILKSID